jgi:hypothetical protein
MPLSQCTSTAASPLREPNFLRIYRRFIETYNAEFPCSFCGILMFTRKALWIDHDPATEYGLSNTLHVPLAIREHENGSTQVAVCFPCKARPQPPIIVGPWPDILVNLPQSCRPYLSPLRLCSNLGKAYGVTENPNPYLTYRSMTGAPTSLPVTYKRKA